MKDSVGIKRHNNTAATQPCAWTSCGPRLTEPTCNIDQCSVGKQLAASQWEPRCQSAQGCWRSLNNEPSTAFLPEPQHCRVVSKHWVVCMSGGDGTSAPPFELRTRRVSSKHRKLRRFPFRPIGGAATRRPLLSRDVFAPSC